ncbi:phosphate ABC transporter permease PstA [Pseudanabaena sp. PCC 6802]|uniref:phosphate ABC transporter permease PstA n=1 Tax=Pseudanabaena sp. PCC 6802 TaxID=118173 RepID=UPI00034A11B0|nr:phosphate ABC transporter permease PstA [Pseudanabaena sp. PCC 6802]
MANTEGLPSIAAENLFEPKLAKRQTEGSIFATACLLATLFGLVILAVLIVDIVHDGLPRLNLGLITNPPDSLDASQAGFRVALLGSLGMLVFVLLLSIPVGVASAIYLEEYAPKNWLTDFIDLNIYNLAGVPSIVYGILGLGLFVRGLYGGGAVLMAGVLTISLLILPPIIVVARESIRAVPQSIRQASYGVGATKWQTIRHHVLPMALPGIMTGVIISTSRGVGETAPLVVLGVGTVLTNPNISLINLSALFSGQINRLFVNTVWSKDNYFSVLPYQIYEWVSDAKDEYRTLASAGIILLMLVVLGMNAFAIFLRNRAN